MGPPVITGSPVIMALAAGLLKGGRASNFGGGGRGRGEGVDTALWLDRPLPKKGVN